MSRKNETGDPSGHTRRQALRRGALLAGGLGAVAWPSRTEARLVTGATVFTGNDTRAARRKVVPPSFGS